LLNKRDLRALRCVLFAGEQFPVAPLGRLMAMLPHARFCNLYGPTETNVCTWYDVPHGTPLQDPLPIGCPCSNTQLAILSSDSGFNDQPGATGEIVVRGQTLMTGYWGQAELTRDAFCTVQNSGSTKLFYRTGDLARRGTDGFYTLLGRKDRQVKIRGYRLELGDVENALASHQAVEEVAAFCLPSAGGTNSLEAAVVLRRGHAATASHLRSHAASRLPLAAVPDRIHLSNTLPRTSNGKVDRDSLISRYAHPT
jgi:acyl-coenzyme A synthetase/AMP-(fatty) acid ligase